MGHNNCRNGNDEVRGVRVCVCVCVCADSHSLLSVTKGNAMAKRTSPTAVDVAGHHGEEDNETAPHWSARHCHHLFLGTSVLYKASQLVVTYFFWSERFHWFKPSMKAVLFRTARAGCAPMTV